ncbi:MAG: biopolymer transporter ExbD [Chitinophagales bacterium]
MADFEAGDGGGHGKGEGKIRSKKMSTRVDLTPMVDLAFLLISFFMLTTTLNKPKAMQLNMPKKDDVNKEKTDVRECQVLNILLDSMDVIWYYEGLQVAGLQKTTFAGDDGIRKQILRKQKMVVKECGVNKEGKPRDLIVLIKMLKGSKYRNMVDILDEMDITQTKIYAIQQPDPIEVEAVANGGTVKEFAKEGAKPNS